MTVISIYPLFSNEVMIGNLIKYSTDSGLTVISYKTLSQDSNNPNQFFATITVSQTLTATQQTTIKNIFQGTAYITFV